MNKRILYYFFNECRANDINIYELANLFCREFHNPLNPNFVPLYNLALLEIEFLIRKGYIRESDSGMLFLTIKGFGRYLFNRIWHDVTSIERNQK